MNASLWFIVVSISICLAAAEDLDEITELKIEITSAVEDCSRKSRDGDKISIHYRAFLASDGTQFDTSYDRAGPFIFYLGAGRVIEGWELGLVGMCVGEKRKLSVPHTLAYGNREFKNKIPARSSLLFETELMSIERKVEL